MTDDTGFPGDPKDSDSTSDPTADSTSESTADSTSESTPDSTSESTPDSTSDPTADPAQAGMGNTPVRPYNVQSWLPLVTELAGDIPVKFAQAWMTTESGGNPCAIGAPGAKGPDGNPREMGLGQLYNPDDFQALNINAPSWRSYCQAGSQTVTRDLTADECRSQVTGLIDLIKKCRKAARQYNPGWSETSADFWRLVKLFHALPGLLYGMKAVTAKLGRGPRDWAEFRVNVMTVNLDANTMKYKSDFAKELDNAEKTGGVL